MKGVAVVAGAGGHTGPALALGLAAAGFDIALLDAVPLDTARTAADKVVRRVEESGRRCVTVESDLADIQSVGVAFGRVRTALGGPAVLVICVAPAPVPEGLPEDASADEQRCAAVRRALRPAFVCCQAGAGHFLRHRRGRIIVVTEPDGAGESAWRTAQPVLAGLIGFTRSAALELARSGSTVNLIAPAHCAADSRAAPARRPAAIGGADAYADGVAHAARFLADEKAAAITGQEIYVAAPGPGAPQPRER
ncbi:SDR family oxidoreductase [Streptomyces flavofungini]|uniref:SDR family oxidoreductase n=1 Tax=Streptomyces flavofungini TaxID=68200 RepID=UPI0034DE87DD